MILDIEYHVRNQHICHSSTSILAEFTINNQNFRTLLQTMQAPKKAQSSAKQMLELGNISVAVKKIFSSLLTLEQGLGSS